MPIGINIYAMNIKALKTVCAIKKQVDTEIWGYLIKRPEIFHVQELPVTQEFIRNSYRLTLDEFNDYELFRKLYQHCEKDEILDLLTAYEYLDAHPDVARLNSDIVQKDLAEEVKRAINVYYREHKEDILNIKEAIYSGTL
jgi:spore coat polysaccharide biosynthesis protein SpsF